MKQSIVMPYHRNRDMLLYTLSLIDRQLPQDIEIIVVGNSDNLEKS